MWMFNFGGGGNHKKMDNEWSSSSEDTLLLKKESRLLLIYLFHKHLLSHCESSNKASKTNLEGKLIHIMYTFQILI